MSGQDYEQLTLFQEDSHASLLVSPGSAEARKMTVTSGLKCSALYKKSGPLGCLVRMCLESSIWHSTRCYLTWRASATPAKRLLFQLAVSMPRTKGSESAFWPTMLASSLGSKGSQQMLQRMVDKGIMTAEEKRQMVRGNGGKINPEWDEWLMGYAKAHTSLLPTPRSADYKTAPLNRFIGGGRYRNQLDELEEVTPLGRIGLLNPEWIEWLMGYPIGWTELNASETR